MKKIVLEIKPVIQEVALDKINFNLGYFGVLVDANSRGFVTREHFNSFSDFTVRCLQDLTGGNGWTQCDSARLSDLIAKALKRGWIVYQFDTPEALMQWIIDGKMP